MAIGVTYDDFWHGDPAIVRYAIDAERVRQRNQTIADDTMAWNTGRYVLYAVGVVMSQAFSKNSTAKYPSEPMIATELDDQLKDQKRERELRKQHADFLAVATLLSSRTPSGAGAQPA